MWEGADDVSADSRMDPVNPTLEIRAILHMALI
jgi:hypothetical protein